ncbi:helix-turn-helix domain-containing protein [Helicobacter bizzozeronii]|uniref:helix-turn-helix domain-containing protein n=1 Tax=Helicobacter bizzozeronii TaxID=56877 RepID=UPI000CF1074A|nr:helix-turn-helix domain-containing protein [Helicobacter bizzozeronii]
MIAKFNPTTRYTAIPNDIVLNSGLSVQALGLAVFINALPSTWQITTEYLCKALKLSPNTIYKYLNELQDKGILKIAYVRFKGRITGLRTFSLCAPKEQDLELQHTSNFNVQLQATKKRGHKIKNALHKGISTITQNLRPLEIRNLKKHGKKSACAQEVFLKREGKPIGVKKSLINFEALKQKINACFNMRLSGLDSQEQEAYERFLAHCKDKHPVSYEQKRAIYQHFLELKAQGFNICELVLNAIRKGYNDVLPPKTRVISNKSLYEKLSNTYDGLTLENFEYAVFKAFEIAETASKEQG